MKFDISDYIENYGPIYYIGESELEDPIVTYLFRDDFATNHPNIDFDLFTIVSPKIIPGCYLKRPSRAYVLWDMYFWLLFYRRLKLISRVKALPSCHVKNKYFCCSYVFEYISLSLSSRQSESNFPYLLHTYSEICKKKSSLSAKEHTLLRAFIKNNKSFHSELTRIAKLFIFFHERMHLNYSLKIRTKEVDAKVLLTLIKELKTTSHPHLKRVYPDDSVWKSFFRKNTTVSEYAGEMEEMRSFVLQEMEDILMKKPFSNKAEEYFSDFFSLVDIMHLINTNSFGNYSDSQKEMEAALVAEAVSLCYGLLFEIKTLLDIWDTYDVMINNAVNPTQITKSIISLVSKNDSNHRFVNARRMIVLELFWIYNLKTYGLSELGSFGTEDVNTRMAIASYLEETHPLSDTCKSEIVKIIKEQKNTRGRYLNPKEVFKEIFDRTILI